MSTIEEKIESAHRLACAATIALSRAGPDPPKHKLKIVGTYFDDIGEPKIIELSINSITITGITPEGEEIHVSPEDFDTLRVEILEPNST